MDDDILRGENPLREKPSGETAPAVEKAILFMVMILVLFIDYITKLLVERNVPLNHTWEPFIGIASIFRITHVTNTGAAFGLFPGGGNLFLIVAIIVSIVIVIYNNFLPKHQYLYRIALGLQMGGAIGNLLSRLRLGHVTDFLDFGPWPVFNIADTSVVCGVILLAYLMLREENRRLKAVRATVKDSSGFNSKSPDEGEDAHMLWNE